MKNNPTPPYLNDLVLEADLNEACQYMAEYDALTNGNEGQAPGGPKHDGPVQPCKTINMHKLGDRIAHFAPNRRTAGVVLAGPGGADLCVRRAG